MTYRGDILLEETHDFKFTSRRFTTGAPFALAGGVISAYVGNGTTEITAGITLSADFDGRTGLNNVRVVATAANGFAIQTNVALVITTGTVDSVSVVGEVVAEFSIQNRSAVAGVDHNQFLVTSLGAGNANVVYIAGQTASAAGTVTFPGTVASSTNITGGTITTVTNLTNAPTAGDLTATMKTSVTTAATAATPIAASVAGNVVGSVGSVAAGGIAAASFAAGAVNAAALAADAGTELADAFLDRNLGTGVDSGGRTVRNALRPNVNKVDVPNGIVFKENDVDTAFTFAVTTDAAALPITIVDPA